jgi:hypothetical protein
MYTQIIVGLLPAIAVAAPAWFAPVTQGNDVSYTATVRSLLRGTSPNIDPN